MSKVALKGSCLCGAVSYIAEGEPQHFFHCHCSRCRRSTGAAHASNLFLQGGSVAWSGQAGQTSTFRLPGAKRFSRTFCTVCGGPLPREIPEMNLVIIPAGTLADEPSIRPEARLFCDSSPSWACDGDGIPRFPGYPPPAEV